MVGKYGSNFDDYNIIPRIDGRTEMVEEGVKERNIEKAKLEFHHCRLKESIEYRVV